MRVACSRALCLAVLCGAVAACTPEAPPHDRSDSATAGAAEATSIVLVVVDTLRADHLGAWGYARPTSPHIDALAADAAVFERAFSPSPWTGPSMGSLFTGHAPSRHRAGEVLRDDAGAIVLKKGRKVFAKPAASVPMLAELLSHAGYATAAIMTNAVLSPGSGFERGFAHYEHLGKKARGPAVTDAALTWLDGNEAEPFFLVVHYFDPHMPYAASGEFGRRFTEGMTSNLPKGVWNPQAVRRKPEGEVGEAERRHLTAAYDEEIALVDDAIGALANGLRERGVLDRALLVITSDHGEELFDHGGFEHGHALWHEIVHVPLLLRAPGIVAPGRFAEPVTLMDAFATMADVAGLSAGQMGAGRSLRGGGFAAAPPPPFVIESLLYGEDHAALVEWPWKLVVGPGAARMLFDLEADPLERTPVALEGAAATRAHEMEARLEARRTRERAAAPSRIDRELDEETRLQLGGLGYLEES